MAARKKNAAADDSATEEKAAKKPAATKAPKKAVARHLTKELGQLLAKTLLPDLRERSKGGAVREGLVAQWEAERAAKRTGDDVDAWIDRLLEQVGVAWILSCVFVRTLEDRGFNSHVRLAGEGALDSEHLFFDLFPSLGLRDYLLATFRELSHLPGGKEVLGPRHNPAWRLAPSGEALRALVAFFRETGDDGQLVWRFGRTDRGGETSDGIGDTRFLGDLYQDVSEGVRERYALLQTPVFVEEFILDLTLEPAIEEYGLETVRLIDPTCGSGHFLLGAFKRLFDKHQAAAPGLSRKELAGRALAQVYGVDLNPFAAAIARFRLVLAYLEAAGFEKLREAPELPTNVIVADSLLHTGKGQARFDQLAGQERNAAAWGTELFELEDFVEADRVFGQAYHAVVGNPPYITCKDAVLREEYRREYVSAAGGFALGAPFTERFFTLAAPAGFVGLINANSFMKREFGRKLIEEVLRGVDLTHVVDTAGAFIPGHGTPTVLVFGRNRRPLASSVRAVLGKRGEPSTPDDAARGLVWSDIATHWRDVGYDSEYVSVVDSPRASFEKHPWSLGGGGAADLKALLESRAERRLDSLVDVIGFGAVTREDDVFLLSPGAAKRFGLSTERVLPFGYGESVRDWSISADETIVFPYTREGTVGVSDLGRYHQVLWNYRTQLWERQGKGFKTKRDAGGEFYEYSMFYHERHYAPLRITFAFVATHNHFVLDRGGKVFNRTAPIIKLPEGATEEDHLALLAYLNSSTAAFYFRQAGHSKGAQGVNEGHKSETWEQFLEYSGALVGGVRVPELKSLGGLGGEITKLASARMECEQRALLDGRDEDHRGEAAGLLRRMVALQEQVDFEVYRIFGIVDAMPQIPEQLEPGHRAFEVQLAAANPRTAWFSRNLYADPTTAPRYFEVASASREVQLLEQPEHKRRWTVRDFDANLRSARQDRALAGMESALSASPGPLPVAVLASANVTADLVRVNPELPAVQLASALVVRESVPYLAALRYTDAGLEKRAKWEETWALQRREDAGEKLTIPVPPKYDAKDFRDPNYFRIRGKLDVPKERFISYPGAEKDDDKSPLYGWAGWDHLQQATALAALYHERKTEDGWPADRLVPLLAGLLELVPWLKQWHNAASDDFGGEGAGDWYERYVEGEARGLGKGVEELRGWRPEKRGRR